MRVMIFLAVSTWGSERCFRLEGEIMRVKRVKCVFCGIRPPRSEHDDGEPAPFDGAPVCRPFCLPARQAELKEPHKTIGLAWVLKQFRRLWR